MNDWWKASQSDEGRTVYWCDPREGQLRCLKTGEWEVKVAYKVLWCLITCGSSSLIA